MFASVLGRFLLEVSVSESNLTLRKQKLTSKIKAKIDVDRTGLTFKSITSLSRFIAM